MTAPRVAPIVSRAGWSASRSRGPDGDLDAGQADFGENRLGEVLVRALLADELVRLAVMEAVSHETVRRTLKQTRSSRT